MLRNNNVSEDLYTKMRSLYFKLRYSKDSLNPFVKEDLEAMKTEEFQLLNDLGLVIQEENSPYTIRVRQDHRELFKFSN